jgi:hypothetical protein
VKRPTTKNRAARRRDDAEARRAARRKVSGESEARAQFYGALLTQVGLIGPKAVAFHTQPQMTFALLANGKGTPGRPGRPGYCARCGEDHAEGVVLPFMGTVAGQMALLPPSAADDPKGVRVALCHACVDAVLKRPEGAGEAKP